MGKLIGYHLIDQLIKSSVTKLITNGNDWAGQVADHFLTRKLLILSLTSDPYTDYKNKLVYWEEH